MRPRETMRLMRPPGGQPLTAPLAYIILREEKSSLRRTIPSNQIPSHRPKLRPNNRAHTNFLPPSSPPTRLAPIFPHPAASEESSAGAAPTTPTLRKRGVTVLCQCRAYLGPRLLRAAAAGPAGEPAPSLARIPSHGGTYTNPPWCPHFPRGVEHAAVATEGSRRPRSVARGGAEAGGRGELRRRYLPFPCSLPSGVLRCESATASPRS
jgi:hypothetical protein